LTPFETMQGLRKQLVAEWVISYLNLLHAFGNEAAHHKMQSTHPPEIDSHDLTVCLFAIQRVLDFWFGLRQEPGSQRGSIRAYESHLDLSCDPEDVIANRILSVIEYLRGIQEK
jgi:hypothetical protein